MYDQQVAYGNIMFAHQAAYGFAAQVDECLWFSQHHFCAVYFTQADL